MTATTFLQLLAILDFDQEQSTRTRLRLQCAQRDHEASFGQQYAAIQRVETETPRKSPRNPARPE